ncbi:hypothetical protein RchiOBHm_Chr5g0040521 [Rosa chinensis]|uniref:Uncharacterized protein n=1 Tax=Rosa chinensis TaxID=74649 RepID=A0A2P6QCL2_ROSCH|nr:hypothetical protein RchiOBHm_Chr5g0040521 [Rosa chinensis]
MNGMGVVVVVMEFMVEDGNCGGDDGGDGVVKGVWYYGFGFWEVEMELL